MPPRLTVETEIYASHHQFYVVDAESRYRTDLVWDGHGLERHLGVAEGVVAVGTVGYCDVPVCIELWDEEPPLDVEGWDHVAEGSLDVPTGRLGLHGVEGPSELESLDLASGSYRVRSSAAGLDGADEMDGGDRYRVQVWPSPTAAAEVLKSWSPWDPSRARARPTRGGETLIGAEAHDRRMSMEWLASRGEAHLFRDDDGSLWEHSNLPDAGGTPQLERLDGEEAARRYGHPEGWEPQPGVRPSPAQMLRNVWQTWRYARGRRPGGKP